MTTAASGRDAKRAGSSGARPAATAPASADPTTIARILEELRLNWRIPGGMS